ncbi:MAG: metal-dependent hydrolase [Halodesulfurarchaeum sp.]
MFVGHAALAFALVGLGARRLGATRERAMALGIVAAAAATLPDVDILYALPTLVSGIGASPIPVETFWDSASAHRSLTHSLLVAVPVAAAIGLISEQGRARLAGLGLAAGLGTALLSLPAGRPAVVLPFVLGAVLLGAAAGRLSRSGPAVGLAAGIALFSHPFGDLVTGDPPWFFYPAGFEVVSGRVTLAPDPTLHLLGAFFLELGAVWLGLAAVAHLRNEALPGRIKPRAALGAVFAAAGFLIPAPTLAESYQFVFGVLAMGLVGLDRHDRFAPLSWTATAMAAVTLAGAAYAVVYLVAGL